MKKAKLFGLGAVALTAALVLGACGGGKGGTDSTDSSGSASGKTDAEHSVILVTDIGGTDDRSFNQSAWEGLQAWGEEHGLSKGPGGFDYIQSNDASQYTTNVDSAVSSGFKTVFGIGYLLKDSIAAGAAANPDVNFGLIDDVIEGQDNVVSATFKDHEAAYLAGVAAAYTTKTDKLGFIGGEEGPVIDRFQAGFEKGVADAAKELKKDIKVEVKYAASFGDPAKGKALAASMYQNGADIIYHASGGTGNGVFQEATALNEAGDKDKVWVIGVDSDQQAEGEYTNKKTGEKDNFTLTSTLKGVGAAVKDISNRALDGKFPGGEHLVYGLKDGGVDLTDGYLTDEAKAAVEAAKEKIIAGDIEIPEAPTK
ncbi:BMP family ABC transporter substrate-binding protein [Enterococcus sp. JM4C]|uniref:BMP family lipoprotein n=1 Tax=Candidatus Enterococcus huntleyi TaxID=1857217 RepID=UPI001379B92D|nr:BMP family ABC transporter substrate-binding protein [Enterococcus sp. JM4C]KAF1298426.1 BMP family ABC transporter substrate-binding protein [Enterococcus sp. JM4C]